MPHPRTIAIAGALLSALWLPACQGGGSDLVAQWSAECAAEGSGSRTTGLAACVAKKRANYEAESLSVPANL